MALFKINQDELEEMIRYFEEWMLLTKSKRLNYVNKKEKKEMNRAIFKGLPKIQSVEPDP